jgi:hypothetical protein
VSTTFRAGCPRNNLRTNYGTFIAVERLDNVSLTWQVVHTDDDWCTKFRCLGAVVAGGMLCSAALEQA